MRTQRIHPAETPVRASAADLALVVEVAALIDSGCLFDSLDAAVGRLREHSGAQVCELFLAAPGGEEVFLVSHQGEDRVAFSQQERFRSGEGFPGLVLAAATSLVTRSLPAESDFVRSRVKSLDYRSAICVPVRCGEGVAGCLLVAWKHAGADLKRTVRVGGLVGKLIGTTVELVHSRTRVRELERLCRGRSLVRHPGGDAQDLPAIEPIAVVGFGDAAPRGGSASGEAASGSGAGGRPRAACDRCPAGRTGRIQVLGGRMGWPRACLDAGCAARARYCIPLSAGGGVWGVATVAFRERVPVPLTRYLPEVLWRVEDVAPPDAAGGNGRSVVVPPPSRADLRIRCLGRFEVVLDGRPLERADFGREKARELLALLVAGSGRPVPGEELAEALWPGVAPGRARNRFHVTLSALRSTVEPGGRAEGGRWTYVRRDGRRYYLDAGPRVFVDAWHLHALLHRAAAAESAGRPVDEVAALLEEAVGLYHGDGFHREFPGDWHAAFRLRCRKAVLRAYEHLADLKRRAGNPDGAAVALRRAEQVAGC